jgi:hypothetical protein
MTEDGPFPTIQAFCEKAWQPKPKYWGRVWCNLDCRDCLPGWLPSVLLE